MTWSKKLDRNVRHGERIKKEMNDLEKEISSKCTTWSKKLDRNLRLGGRNYIEIYDSE